MTRSSPMAAVIAGLLLGMSACSEDGTIYAPPDEDALRDALRDYYERTGGLSRTVERHTRILERDEARNSEGEEQGDEDQPDERPCPRFEFRYMDRNGEWRRGSYRLPCEIMDKAESEVSSALEEMAQALSEMSEAARREIRELVITEIAEVERIGCVPAQSKPGFVCDVEATLVYGEDKESQRFLTGRFVKSDSGWRAFELEEHR